MTSGLLAPAKFDFHLETEATSSSETMEESPPCSLHEFSEETVLSIQNNLLSWYKTNKRKLPWRDIAETELDPDIKGYAVWVSEVMLQQTQVATVIKYYNTWMAKWPTVQDLAGASLEEVNQVWAGLGYYSRAKCLHEGAQHITKNLNGHIPKDSAELMKEVKGIGRYTAAAISSIAFGEVVGLVDGNVSRVLSRLRIIGTDITKQHTKNHLWHLADTLVDPTHPGDFNQAVMELGATVCKPQKPDCKNCPLKTHCLAYLKEEKPEKVDSDQENLEDIESDCSLCLPKGSDQTEKGVCVYPQKATKRPPRKETLLTLVLENTGHPNQWFMARRPNKGLLAGLWEFPNFPVSEGQSLEHLEASLTDFLKETFQLSASSLKEMVFTGEVVHIFSHIHTTFQVFKVSFTPMAEGLKHSYQDFQWLSREGILEAAVSTAMKKVLKCVENNAQEENSPPKKRAKDDETNSTTKQTTLLNFLIK